MQAKLVAAADREEGLRAEMSKRENESLARVAALEVEARAAATAMAAEREVLQAAAQALAAAGAVAAQSAEPTEVDGETAAGVELEL